MTDSGPTDGESESRGAANLDLAGSTVATDFSDWSPELIAEFKANARNYQVGGTLLSDDGRVKVWDIRLKPGERLPAHRHVLDYFWTAVTPGDSVQHTDDGTTRRVSYQP